MRGFGLLIAFAGIMLVARTPVALGQDAQASLSAGIIYSYQQCASSSCTRSEVNLRQANGVITNAATTTSNDRNLPSVQRGVYTMPLNSSSSVSGLGVSNSVQGDTIVVRETMGSGTVQTYQITVSGGSCSLSISHTGIQGGPNQPRPVSCRVSATRVSSNSTCGVDPGPAQSQLCTGSNEQCRCIELANTCPYPVSVAVLVSPVNRGSGRLGNNLAPQGDPDAKKRMCATSNGSQDVSFVGFKPWAGFPKSGQPRPMGR